MLNVTCRRTLSALVAAVAVCVALSTTDVGAQSPTLAELARQEQARRKGQKTPSKVYTKKDLPPSPPAPAGSPAPQAPPAQAAPEAKPDVQPGDEKDETWWKNRINQAREELRRNEMFAEALQSRINALSTDFVNRDDPYQRAQIGTNRDKSIAELARVKADMERGKQQIADIEEEARKASVPPGWLR